MGGETAAGRDSFAYSVRLFDEDDTENEADWVKLTSWHQSLSGHVGMLANALSYTRVPELYDPHTNTWDELDQAPLGQAWYPFTFSIDGGNAFNAGPSDSSWKLNLSSETWTRYPSTSSSGFHGGSAVMLGTRVMKAGSGLGEAGPASIGTTKSIDLEDASPAWEASTDMLPRYNHNLVILPTGEVLVVGGTQVLGNNTTNAQNRPEIWDPNGSSGGSVGVWYGGTGADTLSADPYLRDYHSTALLLPDGRVLSAGGNADMSQAVTANIYCPPYLFDSNGNTVARPSVSSVARYANYEGDIDIITSEDDSITSVCLLRPGAVTHGFNQSQRYVELEWSYETNPARIVAVAPDDPGYAPPGDYLLFVLKESPDNDAEVSIPSIGQWVRLSSDVTAPAKRNPAADLVSQTSIGIDWTSPGDDDTVGTAQKYELRRSFSPITEANWQSATVVPNDPAPQPSGTYHVLGVYNLSPCTPYYFALLTRDEANNFSAISDTISARTMCSGGGGLGESAREVVADEGTAARSSGAVVEAPAAEAPEEGGSEGSVTIDANRRQGLATGGGSVPHHVAVEFESSGASIHMTLLRTSEPIDGLSAGDSSGIVFQISDGSGGWITQGQLEPGLMDGLFGMRPATPHCRYVCLGDYDLTHVPAITSAGGGAHALTSATHSQLGEVTSTVAADGYVAMADGDVLSTTFSATTPGEDDLEWLVVLKRQGSAGSTAWSQRAPAMTPKAPLAFALHPNQPNPFRGPTTIRFDLPVPTDVKLEVFDLLGRRVRTLARASFKPGHHSVGWDRRDSRGHLLRAGVFMARIQAGSFEASQKMVLMP